MFTTESPTRASVTDQVKAYIPVILDEIHQKITTLQKKQDSLKVEMQSIEDEISHQRAKIGAYLLIQNDGRAPVEPTSPVITEREAPKRKEDGSTSYPSKKLKQTDEFVPESEEDELDFVLDDESDTPEKNSQIIKSVSKDETLEMTKDGYAKLWSAIDDLILNKKTCDKSIRFLSSRYSNYVFAVKGNELWIKKQYVRQSGSTIKISDTKVMIQDSTIMEKKSSKIHHYRSLLGSFLCMANSTTKERYESEIIRRFEILANALQ